MTNGTKLVAVAAAAPRCWPRQALAMPLFVFFTAHIRHVHQFESHLAIACLSCAMTAALGCIEWVGRAELGSRLHHPQSRIGRRMTEASRPFHLERSHRVRAPSSRGVSGLHSLSVVPPVLVDIDFAPLLVDSSPTTVSEVEVRVPKTVTDSPRRASIAPPLR